MISDTLIRDRAERLAVYDRLRTSQLLRYPDLIDAIEQAARDCKAGTLISPERMVVGMESGGVMLSMPATASDISIHKLVNVQPANASRGLPTIHGMVTICETGTGKPLCVLDGPEVTGRRTAAVSMLAVRSLMGHEPREALIIGTGAQARFHLQALAAVHPRCKVHVRGTNPASAARFCANARDLHCGEVMTCDEGVPDGVDLVITLTTSTQPVYDQPPRTGRLVIGVGAFKPEMAEIGATTLTGSDLYADDLIGAQHEAGDLMRAGIDWKLVVPLGDLLEQKIDHTRPVVFKSVGTAAWDLAAARVAMKGVAAL